MLIAITELKKQKKDQKNRLIISGNMTEICSRVKLLFAFCSIKFHSSRAGLFVVEKAENYCEIVFFWSQENLD